MGARHSARRDWSFDSCAGGGDATSASVKTSHRPLPSSGKLRTRWPKLGRSHSDRAPGTRSRKLPDYGDTRATKDSVDDSPANGYLFVSNTCHTTELQSVSTQTACDVPNSPKRIDDGHHYAVSGLLYKDQDVRDNSNFNSSQKSHDWYVKLYAQRNATETKLWYLFQPIQNVVTVWISSTTPDLLLI